MAAGALAQPGSAPANLLADARDVVASPALPTPQTSDFLRRAAAGEAGTAVAAQAQPLLDGADNKSGLLSFRFLAPFALLVCLIFAIVVVSDRRAGGYMAQVDRARLKPAARA